MYLSPSVEMAFNSCGTKVSLALTLSLPNLAFVLVHKLHDKIAFDPGLRPMVIGSINLSDKFLQVPQNRMIIQQSLKYVT